VLVKVATPFLSVMADFTSLPARELPLISLASTPESLAPLLRSDTVTYTVPVALFLLLMQTRSAVGHITPSFVTI